MVTSLKEEKKATSPKGTRSASLSERAGLAEARYIPWRQRSLSKEPSPCLNEPIRNELRQQKKWVTNHRTLCAKGLRRDAEAHRRSKRHIGRAGAAVHASHSRCRNENAPGDVRDLTDDAVRDRIVGPLRNYFHQVLFPELQRGGYQVVGIDVTYTSQMPHALWLLRALPSSGPHSGH
jgi:hypothetical protein